MDYPSLYERLGLPAAALKMARGQTPPPSTFISVPFEAYGFPPALLPIWSDGPTYHGYWKHWFNDRELTIVYYDVEEGRAYEVARNIEQLVWHVALKIYEVDWVDPKLESFVGELVGGDLKLLDEIARKSGDLPEGLRELPAFRENPPLQVLPDAAGYDGDFPHEGMDFGEQTARRISTLEVSRELRAELAARPSAPEWFTAVKQPPVFRELLSAGDLGGAWMSLNSSGWRYAEAKEALRALGDAARREDFSTLVEAWVAQPHEDAGGY